MSRPVSRQVRGVIPSRYIKHHRVVPLELEGGRLHVAHPNDVDRAVLRELQVLLGQEVVGEVWRERELDAIISQSYGIGAQEIEALTPDISTANGTQGGEEASSENAEGRSEDAAMVAFVNSILFQAANDGATDIHIEPFEGQLRVRFRIDGMLHTIPVPEEVWKYRAAVVSRIKVMAGLDIAERRLPQDGKFRHTIDHSTVDYRVSVLPTPHGETINVRVLAGSITGDDLEGLGFRSSDVETVRGVLSRPHGVVLVTGPTGSGKTTTLYTFLRKLNETHRKIITIEDPVEYDLPGVTQIQVRPKIGLGFAEGLRSMLRHDPDVMMVGEIRDSETAETVIRVALTGHLVFSTVHTNDAVTTPIRLLDMGMEPYLVASSVECIIAQRLVRVICDQCREPDERRLDLAALGLERFESRGPPRGEVHLSVGRGCEACRGTGFVGRTAIFETLPMTSGIRKIVQNRGSAEELQMRAAEEGGVSLRAVGLSLAMKGRTSVDEVLRVTGTPHGVTT